MDRIQPEDGLTPTEHGLVRADRLTATGRAMLYSYHATALAKTRRSQETLTAITLACLEMTTGDPVHATVIGTTAVREAAALRSPRVLDKLRELARCTTRHPDVGEATALRHRITGTVLAS